MMNRRRALHTVAALGFAAAYKRQAPSLLVRGGRLVTVEGQRDADVRIREGKVVEVGPKLTPADDVVLEARGLLVLPGGVDPHTHLSPPWADDFESGSKAAVAGGLTTLGCMTSPNEDESLLEAIEREEARAKKEAIADVFLHPVVGTPDDTTRNALTRFSQTGRTSLKIFMTSSRFDENEASYVELIRHARSLGMLTVLHCEDARLLAEAARRLKSEGRTSLVHFPESRPVEAESRAVERAVGIAETTGAPIYIVHLSSKAALDVAAAARERGARVGVETRPLYLHFTDERFAGPEGPLFVGQPPLRKRDDVDALWKALGEGGVDTVASDHAPWTREQKLDPSLDVEKVRPGVANLQCMLPVLFSEGVVRRKLPLERFVAATSTNAAKLFGLYPVKGAVAAGSDADLALWDPAETREIERRDLLSRAGFSLFEGFRVTGWPRIVLRRGEIVFRDGSIQSSAGSGRIAPRGPTQWLRA
jgi:dihydropyrimidinase